MKKSYTKNGDKCRVTFELPAEAELESAVLCGEFNNWDKSKHPLTRRKKGNFMTTITLNAGREYRYRFWVNDERWENDWNAKKYVSNDFGSEDSVVIL